MSNFINETLEKVDKKIPGKINYQRFFVSAMFAGVFVSIAVTVYYAIKTNVIDNEVALGIFNMFGPFIFTIALPTLFFFGAELLTSGMMYIGIGKYYDKVKSWKIFITTIAILWLGNLAGVLVWDFILYMGGQINPVSNAFNYEYIETLIHTAEFKLALNPLEMFARGLICNIIIGLALISSGHAKSEGAKIFFCVFFVGLFLSAGGEHIVANLGLFCQLIFGAPEFLIANLWPLMMSLIFVTLGNLVAGTFIVGMTYSWLNEKISI